MYIVKIPQKAGIPLEGVVSEWLVSKGTTVKKGTAIVRVEGFGQTIELESPVTAELLEIITPVGEFCSAGQPLAILGKHNEDVRAVLKSLNIKAIASQSTADNQPAPKQNQTIVKTELLQNQVKAN
jgi:pyruvate/2-oxoglutarate dehydrogenase complex dihydrolipoamide acyltransferase (E2) component